MRRKRLSSLNMFMVAAATSLLATGAQAQLNPPHDATNGIGCTSCHLMTSTYPKMLPPLDHTPVDIDDTLANNVCWSCHNDVDAAHTKTHSSTQLGTGYGNWTVECWVCHNEHRQEQNIYNGSTYGKYIRRTIDLSKITGLAKTGLKSVVFTGPTTFADGIAPYNGVCEVCHTQTSHFTNDGSGDNHDGKAGSDCTSCHNHSTSFQGGADHSTFIADDNETGNPAKVCSGCHTNYAANPETAHSACTVCHTTAPDLFNNTFPTYNGQPDDDGTSMFTNMITNGGYLNVGTGRITDADGTDITGAGGDLTFTKIKCGVCHAAKPDALQAGNHGGHTATDFPWDATTQTSCGTVGCHDYVANGNVVADIHGNTCTICHDNAGGGDGTTIEGSATNGIDGDARLGSTASPHTDNCLVCHPAATYDRSTVHHTSKNGYAAAGNCTQCHAGTNYPGDHAALVSLAANCLDCHNGTQGTTGGMPVNAANNKLHDACTTCHNTDNDATLKAPYGKAQAMPNGGAGSNNGGGSCEACHTSGFSGYHATVSHSPMVSLYANCATCHTGTQAPAGGAVPLSVADNKKHDACTVCHGADGRLIGSANGHNGGTPGGSDGGGNCSVCHGEYMYSHTNINHTTTVALNANCADCHTGTQGNATTVPLDVANNKKHDTCSQCHAQDGTLVSDAAGKDGGTPGGTDGGGDCSTCHSTFYDNHFGIDHSAMVAAYVNCSTCHVETGNTVDPGDPKVHDACSACHQANGRLQGSASGHDNSTIGGTDGGGTCFTCHGEYFNSHGNINHTGTVAGAASCVTCHTATAGTATTVPTSGADNKVHDACSTCHQATGILVTTPTANGWTTAMPNGGTGGGTDGGGDCTACHGAYFNNHVHGTTGGYVEHDVTYNAGVDLAQGAPGTPCASCHIPTVEGTLATWGGVLEEHVTGCARCHSYIDDGAHSPPQAANDNAIASGVGVTCVTCHTEKLTPLTHGGHDATHFAWTASCGVAACHDQASNPDVANDIHGDGTTATCTICHSSASGGTGTAKVGDNGDGDATNGVGAPPHAGVTCVTCHNDAVLTIYTGGIHHDTVPAANNNCTSCHDGTNLVQKHDVVVATSASCVAANCHPAATAGTATTISVDPADGLKHNACISCHTFDSNLSGILRTAPNTKGVTLMPNGGDDSRLDATPNGGGDCIACHYGTGATAALRATSRVTFHHANTNTASGNCDYCHYDHRPDTGYSTVNVNAATGLDNAGGNVPTHLLCEECHVKPESAVGGQNNNGDTGNTRTDGYAGGNVTVTAFNKGTDTFKTGSSWFTAPVKSTVHTVPNTAAKIDNWGICISCHDGTGTLITGLTAPTVQPMHALPVTINNANGDYCYDNATVRGTYTNGKGAYLPGRRLYNAMSNINYFGDDWRPSSTRSNAKSPTRNAANVVWALDNGRCGRNAGQFAQITGAYKSAGRLWDNTATTSLSEKLIPNPWNGVQYNNPYTVIRDQLPFFAAQTAVTDITPSYDIVSVTSATMSGGTLTVVASVINGNCTDLTLQTGAGNAAFNTSCQASRTYSYPANGLTVNVVSAQPGVYVYNYPITP